MKTKEKVVLGAGALALLLLMARQTVASDAVIIQIFDSHGNLVPHNSAFSLLEGETYTVKVTVNNRTTRGGAAYRADLTLSVSAGTSNHVLIAQQSQTGHFAAGESLSFGYTMAVPQGSVGESGTITATVFAPTGGQLASQARDFTIAASITYGADVDIGGTAPPSAPLPPPPSGLLRPPCGNMGDLDDDGYVTIGDVTHMEQLILGINVTPERLARADLRGDGSLDVGLITMLEQYILGVIDTFPACSIAPPGGAGILIAPGWQVIPNYSGPSLSARTLFGAIAEYLNGVWVETPTGWSQNLLDTDTIILTGSVLGIDAREAVNWVY